jgi:hypothetical protein
MTMLIKKRSGPPQEARAKGMEALTKWREEQKRISNLPPEERKAALEELRVTKERKRISPQQAIKNFCNECVGGVREDITNCTSPKCSLFVYRPYQKNSDD